MPATDSVPAPETDAAEVLKTEPFAATVDGPVSILTAFNYIPSPIDILAEDEKETGLAHMVWLP